jgi:short-subunit dehydrogenase
MGLAVVTGASSGLGYQFARLAAEDGHDLILCADEERVHEAAGTLDRLGVKIEAVVADLSTKEGFEAFDARIAHRDVDLLFANAGRALGHAFLDQSEEDILRLIELNVTQTTLLVRRVAARMAARGSGRILVTGSIGGLVPGPFDAVYNATKAYLNTLCAGLSDEWRDSPVTLTLLMPGPTDTPIFHRERNRLDDTPIAESERKDDPVDVAEAGYAALIRGDRKCVPGARTKVIAALSNVVPGPMLARIHRWGAEPRR